MSFFGVSRIVVRVTRMRAVAGCLFVLLTLSGARGEPIPAFARGRGALALSGDARLGLFASRQELAVWDLATGKRKHRVRLVPGAWEVHPSPSGETALLVTHDRMVLVQLLTGRVVEDLPAPSPLPAAREIVWAPEGGEVILVGLELPELEPGDGTPVAYFEAKLGYVARQIRIPKLATTRGAAVLRDGDGVVIGLPKQLLVLGRSPFDVRTHMHDGAADFRVLTSVSGGVLVVREGRFEVLDPKTGALVRSAAVTPLVDERFAVSSSSPWLVGTAASGIRVIDLERDTAAALDLVTGGRSRVVLPLRNGVVALDREVRFVARSPEK